MAALWETIQSTLSQSTTWLSILSGFLATARISAASLLFGTLLAVPLCGARMIRPIPTSGTRRQLTLRRICRKILCRSAKAYIALVRGTPVTMLLMVFYYVVFARSRINAEIIATFAFSFHTAAVVAEIMRTALSAVSPDQLDAARALGMSKLERFRSITLPQSLEHGLPIYQNATINLIQWTSVVNYIAVTDLSRAISSAASRMLEPLLMLFVGIALYLLLAYAVHGAFMLIGHIRFGPSYQYDRKRTV